jgi:lysophospholipase L1-like esterase
VQEQRVTLRKPQPSSPRTRLAVAGLSLASLALCLLVAEGVARVWFPTRYRQPPPSRDHWTAVLHRASDVPGLGYELAPNVDTRFWGLPVRTSSLGLRGGEVRAQRDEGSRRICALGDSFTFGFGVRAEDAYPSALQQLFERDDATRRVEVLNMGVGGYSTADEALVLRYKALPLSPDLVTVGFFFNDPETLPVYPLQAAFAPVAPWQHSTLLRRVAWALRLREIRSLGGGDYFRYLAAPEGPAWPGLLEAFRDMGAATRPLGIPVVVLIFPETLTQTWERYPYADLHGRVARAARSAGLEVVDLLGAFEGYPPHRLHISPEDRHPSAFAHRVAAQTLHAYLTENHAARLRAPE